MVYGTMLEQTVMLMYSCIPFFDRFTPFHSILLYYRSQASSQDLEQLLPIEIFNYCKQHQLLDVVLLAQSNYPFSAPIHPTTSTTTTTTTTAYHRPYYPSTTPENGHTKQLQHPHRS
jgi:hypothetical protein